MYASTLKFIKNQIHSEQIYVNERARERGMSKRHEIKAKKHRLTCSMQSIPSMRRQSENNRKKTSCNIDVLQGKKLKSERRTHKERENTESKSWNEIKTTTHPPTHTQTTNPHNLITSRFCP